MHVATLYETPTGLVHHVRNPTPQLWDLAVRRQKKKGMPDKARFRLRTRCGIVLRANSLSTKQAITCIACLSQTQEEVEAREAAVWRQLKKFKDDDAITHTWVNEIMGQWVPYQEGDDDDAPKDKTGHRQLGSTGTPLDRP